MWTRILIVLLVVPGLVACVTPTPEPSCEELLDEAEAELWSHDELTRCDDEGSSSCVMVILDVPCANGFFRAIGRAHEDEFHRLAAEAYAEACDSGCAMAYDNWPAELECRDGRCVPVE